jgi:hypothetical protein
MMLFLCPMFSWMQHRLAASLAVLLGALLLAPIPAQANDPLDADEIRRLVIGKRIYLATPLGGEIPMNYQTNGRVDASGEAVGLGRFLAPKDNGRWWISGNRLCQQWQVWYEGQRMCFTLSRVNGNTLRWQRDNGDKGLARIGN